MERRQESSICHGYSTPGPVRKEWLRLGHLLGKAVFSFTLEVGPGAMRQSRKGGRDHAHLGISPCKLIGLTGEVCLLTGLVMWVVSSGAGGFSGGWLTYNGLSHNVVTLVSRRHPVKP